MLSSLLFVATFLLLCTFPGAARAASNFTFDYGTATQCGNFPMSWTGGSPPFELTLVPAFDSVVTYKIPGSNYSNGKGSYELQLPFLNVTSAGPTRFLAVMSDSNGFGTGGVSNLITVGAAENNAQCNTTMAPPDFTYNTPLSLVQCDYYTFNNYNGANLPITVTGLIPGGTTFSLSSKDDSFQWMTDVASGTDIIFVMTDSKGRQGGTSAVDQVGPSTDSSCLTGNYPASVSSPPSQTATSTSSSTSTSGPSRHSGASGGTIAAAVVATILGVVVVGLAAWFFLRRRRSQRSSAYQDETFYAFRPKRQEGPVDLSSDSAEAMINPTVQPYPLYAPSSMSRPSGTYDPYAADAPHLSPHPMSDAASAADFGLGAAAVASTVASARVPPTPGASSSSSGDQSSSSGARSKAALAGLTNYNPPATRFILHTDAEEVVELPPQYSDLRPPSSVDPNTYPPGPHSVSSGSAPGSEYFDSVDARASQHLQQPLAPSNTAPSSSSGFS